MSSSQVPAADCAVILAVSWQDPCTWRIVLKNTVDLEPVEVQAAAKEKMDALVLSYQHLDSLLDMAREGNTGVGAGVVHS